MDGIRVVSEDFNSLVGFKDGKINIDFSSALLLYGYLMDKSEWVEDVKKREELEFKYTSYAEFNVSLFHQIKKIITDISYMDMTFPKYKNLFDQLAILGAQVDSFCEGIVSDIKFGEEFSEARKKFKVTKNIGSVWKENLSKLYDKLLLAERDSVNYILQYEKRKNADVESINATLPAELHAASSYIVDIISNKQNAVKDKFDSVQIVYYFDKVISAIEAGDKPATMAAYEDFIYQCGYAVEAGCSPYVGDLRRLFECDGYEEICRIFNDKDQDLKAILYDVDELARQMLNGHMNNIKYSSVRCIKQVLAQAINNNLLRDDFSLEKFINAKSNLVDEAMESETSSISQQSEEFDEPISIVEKSHDTEQTTLSNEEIGIKSR